VLNPAARRPLRRAGAGAALSAAALVLTAGWSQDAAAATTLGGLATSVGMLTALVALLAMKGWSAHAAAGSIGGGGAALALGAVLLLWRGWRGAIPGQAWVQARLAAGRRQRAAAPGSLADLRPTLELPEGVDAGALRRTLAGHFLAVQRAWDAADFTALAALTTPEMLGELRDHRDEYGGPAARSKVRGLRPAVLGYERRADLDMVCVEFTGTMHERAGGAQPFRELWMLVRPDARGAWLLARQQMLL